MLGNGKLEDEKLVFIPLDSGSYQSNKNLEKVKWNSY